MAEREHKDSAAGDEREREYADRVGHKEQRMAAARRDRDRSVWFGLGMFGLVGWSVAIPSLVFLAIGIRMDSHLEGRVSWTLTMLVIGIMLGCVNAWFWVKRESRDE